MRAQPSTLIIAVALALGVAPALAAAEEPSKDETEQAGETQEQDKTAKSPRPTDTQPESPPSKRLPRDASAALIRAAAAYEYGDMNQVVESSRPVAEGLLPAGSDEQIQAFRLLGIGLYLTNRPLGAETAFTELLRKDPRARLDPTTTRPEVVAFFEGLRQQNLAKQRSTRRVLWNFIPPAGQFQNDDDVKGWLVLGVGVLSLGTAVTSRVLLATWRRDGDTFPDYDTAVSMRTINYISVGVLAVTYIYGVFDGLVGYSKPIEESRSSARLHFSPAPGGLGFTF